MRSRVRLQSEVDGLRSAATNDLTRRLWRCWAALINLAKLNWAGRLYEQAFRDPIFVLSSMSSRDPRFSDAAEI